MNDNVQYWLETSDEDMITATVMLNGGRYLYVGFMCHLATEKNLKAIIANRNEYPPKIHNLPKLAKNGMIYDDMPQDHKDFLDVLKPFNIEARYSDYKSQLSKSLNSEVCKEMMRKTRELIAWIRTKL